MKTGLCSITFRHIGAEDVAALAQRARLDSVEWGGDIHVRAGELKVAESTRRITEDAGLVTAAYGSYFRVLDESGMPETFDPVLETATALGTDTVRIWAGQVGSDAAEEFYKQRLVENIRCIAEQAASMNVRIGLEFHLGTLADSNSAIRWLLDEVDHPNLYVYWQPAYWVADSNYQRKGLKDLGTRIANLHVFNWRFNPSGTASWNDTIERRPLSESRKEWQHYLAYPLNPDFEHYALIEFVRGNDPAQFIADAEVLRMCLSEPTRPK